MSVIRVRICLDDGELSQITTDHTLVGELIDPRPDHG